MPKSQPNPYRDFDLTALGNAASRRGGELLERKTDLARDTGWLLLICANKLRLGEHTPHTAEWDFRADRDAFWKHADREMRNVRHRCLVRAFEFAASRGPISDEAYELREAAVASDEGLRRVLALLGLSGRH